MNNQDKQLLEDFYRYLIDSCIVSSQTTVEMQEIISKFMSSPYYVESPLEAISTTSLPYPHFNTPKITL